MSDQARALPAHDLAGEGDTVIFLNGGMMTWAGWDPVAERLGGRWRRLRFDFRGQLLTPGPAPCSLDGHARDAVELLDACGIERAHVIGTSFGGAIGIVLAARHPARVRSLVAVTTTDVTTPELARGLDELRRLAREILAGADRRAYVERLVRGVYSERFRRDHADEIAAVAARVAQLPARWFEGLLGILDALDGLDLRPELPAIACPTLVIHAARDALMTRERSQAIAGAIPRARWLEHPESGHALVAEDPAWLADACREFLTQVERDEAAGHAS
ncbi:MAG: alpha/beta fold hydrolase [Acidobacteria bacterium]|nr:MAG: alpha/beta fold hydrolase [Acidobacteriota bacterium]